MADIEKRGYKVYANWRNWLSLLNTEQKAYWVDWVWDYMNNKENEIPQDQALAMAINMAKNVIDVDKENYDKKVDAGKKGGIATQLKQRKAKSSTLKHNKAEESTNEQSEADKIRYDMKRQDMICNDMVCNDISNNNDEEENDNFNYIKNVIRGIEEITGRNVTNDEQDKIARLCNKYPNVNIVNYYKRYKNMRDPLSYITTVIENEKNNTIQIKHTSEYAKQVKEEMRREREKQKMVEEYEKNRVLTAEEEAQKELENLQLVLEVYKADDLSNEEIKALKENYKKYDRQKLINEFKNVVHYFKKENPLCETFELLEKGIDADA